MRRALLFLVRNWPLKLAAIVLATLLYAGFVVSQNAREQQVSVPIDAVNIPTDAFVLTDLGTVNRVTYFVTDGSAVRPSTSSFRATVDLSDVDPAQGPTIVGIELESLDERVRIVSYEPNRVRVELDPFVTRMIPVQVQMSEIPEGLEVREPVRDPDEVAVSGPKSVVDRVVAARASVLIQPTGLNVDQEVALVAVDLSGDPLTPVRVEPATAHITIPVFRDLSNRSVPVSPRVAGVPAAGFEIASVEVDPLLVSVEGNADELATLDLISTDPISVSGASADIETLVRLDLPTGILALGEPTVKVTIRLRPVTQTRTFSAGILLVGAAGDRTYSLSTDRVVVTIFGSPGDLDRLATVPLTVDAPVGGLEPGASLVRLEANLATGLTLVSIDPGTITVTVGVPATPSPEPAVSALPSPSP